MKSVLGLSVIVLSSSTALANTALYDQMTGVTPFSWWGSNANANPDRNARSFDNFTLSSSATVTSVDWNGMLDERYGSDGFQPQPVASISGFRITFYQHDAALNLPGPAIADEFIPSTAVAETNFGHPTASSYSAALTSPVALNAGVQYWFSVAAVLPNPDAPVLLWRGGPQNTPLTTGDGYGAWLNNDGISGSRQHDLLFRLNGVPTPGSAALLTIAGAFAARRRRHA